MKKLILMLMLCAPMAMFAQKFGKVNARAVVESLPSYAKAQGEISALSKQKENEIKSMQDELQRKVDEYQKSQSTMNPTAKKAKEDELNSLSQKVQQAYNDAQNELQKKNAELLQPISASVQDATEKVGKEGGYTFIFEDGAALYTGTTVKDVTAEVKAKLK
jgi:outer membrane protein